jgi:cell division protein FtsQ
MFNFAPFVNDKMTKRKIAWKRIIFSIMMLAITVYMCIYIFGSEDAIVCKNVSITIRNSNVAKLITAADIKRTIEQSRITGKGKPLSEDAIKKIYKLVRSKGSVKNVSVYKTGKDSLLYVEVDQRIPIARILTAVGSCYIDDEGIVFPVSKRYAYDVPLITGNIRIPPEGAKLRDSVFARTMLSFVEYIYNDPFWNAQIQQIDVDENRNVEFVICSDNHLIRFGQLAGFEKKMDNLFTFYKKVNPFYRTKDDAPYTILDLRFNRQIIAIKE